MPEPVEIFGALLDRSIAEIAEVSFDARRFDAGRIAMLSDIWDDNSGPLFVAATGGWRRNALACKGLRWMGDFGEDRREWMIGVEPTLAELLPPAAEDDALASRDFRGVVYPWPRPLTDAEIAFLVADYDLATAAVRSIAVEEASGGREIRVGVRVRRRYECDVDDHVDLRFLLSEPRALAFAGTDRDGLTIERTDSAVTLRWGSHGVLDALDGSVWPDDRRWELSQAGRAADAELPPLTKPAQRDKGLLGRGSRGGEGAGEAWSLLFMAMIKVRRVRSRKAAPRIPVYEVCQALSGAGAGIVAAGRLRGAARRRAFDALAATWKERGLPPEDLERPSLIGGPAHIRYAGYSVGREQAQAYVSAAIPSGDADRPWRLAGDIVADPALFTMTLDAFAGAEEISVGDDGFSIGDVLVVRRR